MLSLLKPLVPSSRQLSISDYLSRASPKVTWQTAGSCTKIIPVRSPVICRPITGSTRPSGTTMTTAPITGHVPIISSALTPMRIQEAVTGVLHVVLGGDGDLMQSGRRATWNRPRGCRWIGRLRRGEPGSRNPPYAARMILALDFIWGKVQICLC
ncbi:hypothetical protein OPQ81_004513 [Rhizoctonia solani]|nr:hypothetical protein OPQ81_004513 [Rhizoctonia solani]